MLEIIPAILEKSLADIEGQLARIRGAVREVQLDIADGILVQNKTWPFAEAAQHTEFDRIAAQEEGLPLWEDFDFEVDLMIQNPEAHALAWVSAGASRIILHAESEGILAAARALSGVRGEDNLFPAKVGLALQSSAEVGSLELFEGLYDFVQVMGIERVGFQGQAFDERAVALVAQLRARHSDLTIQVDGGVTLRNARALAQAGTNRLIAGSAIFGSSDPKKEIEELRREANRT